MGVCFVHTADWQIGKQFGHLPAGPQTLLTRQRIETVRTIARVAADANADAVLVAGDVFDAATVSDETIRRTLLALEGFRGPWVLLPGNHDAALAASPWTRLPQLDMPANVIVAARPEPIALVDGRMTVLPAPLQRRHEAIDLTEWFDAAATAEGCVRVGLAHGSVAGLLPDEADASNPIAPDRAARARLDYLALGDWHGTLSVNDRTWYAGTPEPDRFRDNDQGNVLLVRIEAQGTKPRIEKIRTGHYHWRQREMRIFAGGDIDAVMAELESLAETPDRTLVSLSLSGTVDLATRAALTECLERWRARVFCLLADDTALIAEPSADDLDRIDRAGFVRQAVEALRRKADDPADPERDIARLALQILYQHHQRPAV